MKTASPVLFTSPYSKKHDTGAGHPENTGRIVILEKLFAEAPFCNWPQVKSKPATLDQILLAHDEDYVFNLQDLTPDDNLRSLDGDTILCPDSYDAALYAAGAACQAVDHVLKEPNKRAFVAVRPPGHHAEPNTAMGFCLFNNIFIAARHAQIAHHIKKIAIVDYDVHHGNGTETMCRRHNTTHPDTPIFYTSSHGHPLFPMTGDPAKNDDTTLNIRLPDNCSSTEFRDLYEEQVFPALNNFAPDLLLLSSGFDAHRNDPLAPINWETEDYAWLTTHLCAIADKHANGQLVSILEGGYDLDSLKECVQTHLEDLAFTRMASYKALEK
ncbi:MAG: histone deacetylase family protein [Alphaproteobacteria bacterium]